MQTTEKRDIGQSLILAAGFIAAGVFVLVSMAANFRFGVSLATTPFGQILYGGLSLGADLAKVAFPLLILALWRSRYRIFATISATIWLGLVLFSLLASIGFAASTRGETVTVNQTAIDSREAWKATIERVEKQLDQLGIPRAGSIIQAEIDALLRTPGADGCTVINGPVTEEVCPKVDVLRKELAVADRVAELEAELVAARKQLQAVPVAASVADPQTATLARLTQFAEAHITDGIAVLIAFLLETVSGLGFTLVALAGRPAARAKSTALRKEIYERRHPETKHGGAPGAGRGKAPKDPDSGSLGGFVEDTSRKTRKSRSAIAQDAKRGKDIALIDAPTDHVNRWTLTRLDILNSGRIQAAAAYQDFAAWCKTEGIEPCTLQMFGRLLTGIVEGMGGRKLKVNGRAYYQGVALQERPARTGQRKKIAVS